MSIIGTLVPGSTLVGDYLIIRLLGSGGFGNTYLAMDRNLNREVAIKEFFPRDIAFREHQTTVSVKNAKFEGSFKSGLDRFVQEAKLLAKFRHPNIVRVFRTFEANHTSYIVLDFVRGPDLETWLRQLGRRPTQQELDELVVPLTDALALLHEAKVLHRDIKPANICIREETGDPVLLDFGAWKYSVSEMTGTTAAIVSPGYSPYEAYTADSKQQGAWTDIYGLGATVYRALMDASPPEAPERLLNDTMVLLRSQQLPGFRPDFLTAVDWALGVQPRTRPQSVAEWQPRLLAGSDTATLGWRAGRDDVSARRPEAASARPRMSIDRRLLAMALLSGIVLCALPLAVVFYSREDAVVGSFFSGTLPASIAGFSRDKLPPVAPGSRWSLSSVGNEASARDTYYAVFQQVEFSGRRLDRATAADWQECATVCLGTKDCTSFTFTPAATLNCELKANLAASKIGPGISGVLFQGRSNKFGRFSREGVLPMIYKISVLPAKPP